MVHALHEAQRVLQPNGILFDLRPAPVHRRVGIQSDGKFQEVAVMREYLEDDYVANRAVKQILREGLFKSEKYVQFNCNRILNRLSDLREWLTDFADRGGGPMEKSLLAKVERVYENTPGRKKIIVHAPLMLRRLRNLAG
jgi:hypothetical protein